MVTDASVSDISPPGIVVNVVEAPPSEFDSPFSFRLELTNNTGEDIDGPGFFSGDGGGTVSNQRIPAGETQTIAVESPLARYSPWDSIGKTYSVEYAIAGGGDLIQFETTRREGIEDTEPPAPEPDASAVEATGCFELPDRIDIDDKVDLIVPVRNDNPVDARIDLEATFSHTRNDTEHKFSTSSIIAPEQAQEVTLQMLFNEYIVNNRLDGGGTYEVSVEVASVDSA